MKIENAEKQIRREWLVWSSDRNVSNAEVHFFYKHLEENREDLLNFRTPENKYQRISGWVTKWRGNTTIV